MSAANARGAAQAWFTNNSIPEDLRGRTLQLVTFDTEEDCRFFYPRRLLGFHQMITTEIRKEARRRGADVIKVTLYAAQYQGEATDAARREYADSQQRLLE